MEKIVVLNSGGFDSIVLLHYLTFIDDEEYDIYSLHFDYGARNEVQQKRCVDLVCDKLNIHNKTISLPRFDWSKSDMYDSDAKDTSYIEWRNLIFLSYALSYAESIGAEEIYLALIGIQDYKDTTFDFMANMNYISQSSDISILAPFLNNSKQRLAHIANYLGIQEYEYFSCDVPKDNKPCGMCKDCLALKEIWQKAKHLS